MDVEWAEHPAKTPQGIYLIEGSNVYKQRYVVNELTYSGEYLREPGNIWAQWYDIKPDSRERPTTSPWDILYDPASGNVLVALGSQGIAVLVPDGHWEERPVGTYSKGDFSAQAKMERLTDGGFWILAFAFALTLTSLVTISAIAFSKDIVATASLAALCSLGYVVGINVAGLIWVVILLSNQDFLPVSLVVSLFGLPALLVAASPWISCRLPKDAQRRRGVALGCIIVATAALIWLSTSITEEYWPPPVPYFKGTDFTSNLILAICFSLIPASVLVLTCRLGHILISLGATSLVYAATIGSYLLWVTDYYTGIHWVQLTTAIILVPTFVAVLKITKGRTLSRTDGGKCVAATDEFYWPSTRGHQ